ncbi:MAG TPA: outer membrane beta-barrel protein, partial [Longimicrobiaceae bacterium]|nr:outer membrane beta-barrel protein [Longimicrobiaceae bacterium]
MSKHTLALGALLATAALAAPARAQLPHITPFSFEGRAGAALPMGDFDDAGASRGWTVSGSVTYHALPYIGIYAGYTQTRFGTDDDLFGDGEFTDAGWDVGVMVGIPTPLIPIDPWIRGGMVFHRLDAEGFTDPALNVETETGMGFAVGAGLGMGFGLITFTPGVSLVRYMVDGDVGDRTVSYIKA